MTNRDRTRDSAVVISSTMPSAKHSCSGSPLMFWKGRTAREGLSGKESAMCSVGADAKVPRPGLSLLGDPIDPNRTGDVLEGLFAHVLEGDFELATDLIVGC